MGVFGRADVIVANISSQTVLALLPAMADVLAPGGIAILSGFIEPATSTVEAATRTAGLDPVGTTADGEWRCLVAQKTPPLPDVGERAGG